MIGAMAHIEALRDARQISEITLRFCEFLNRVEPNCSRGVLIAACLVSSRKEQGDVCIELGKEAGRYVLGGENDGGIMTPAPDEWIRECRSSSCVGNPGDSTPLILDGSDRLYLQRFWKNEFQLAENLLSRAKSPPEKMDDILVKKHLGMLFGINSGETDWQKAAAYTALKNKLTIISGGPGTGKTTTVIRILILLARMDLARHAVLAAPTGKAAARLKESLLSASADLKLEEAVRQRLPREAYTIHRLLGIHQYRPGAKYNRSRPLPYDVVVIDEASMIDLSLMQKVTEALSSSARLILLGDKDQLSSVEAGAVLGSICPMERNRFSSSFLKGAKGVGLSLPPDSIEEPPGRLTDRIVLLKKSYRFDENRGIARLSSYILEGRAEQAVEILEERESPDVTLKTFEDSVTFRQWLSEIVKEQIGKEGSGLHTPSDTGILCVHRRGRLGSEQVNRMIEHRLREEGVIPADREWYPGKRVMMMKNDYTLGLRNGDVGWVMSDEDKKLKVFFPSEKEGYNSFYPGRLSYIETAYAITVHKSQGSEFEHTIVILPQQISPVMSRELLYTAVSRSISACTIVGSREVLKEGILRKADRASGLKERLWES